MGAARFARGNRRCERHPGFRIRFLRKHRLRLFLQRERQQLRLYRLRPLQRVDGRENLHRGAGARRLHLRFRQQRPRLLALLHAVRMVRPQEENLQLHIRSAGVPRGPQHDDLRPDVGPPLRAGAHRGDRARLQDVALLHRPGGEEQDAHQGLRQGHGVRRSLRVAARHRPYRSGAGNRHNGELRRHRRHAGHRLADGPVAVALRRAAYLSAHRHHRG